MGSCTDPGLSRLRADSPPRWPSGTLRGMSIDPKLLEILVCPQDKGPLTYLEEHDVLYNERLEIAYRIEDGIPVMLPDEAIIWPPQS